VVRRAHAMYQWVMMRTDADCCAAIGHAQGTIGDCCLAPRAARCGGGSSR
jgi:hypothetical protein